METHQLFTRQSLSRHRCQYLFAWWRKNCQSSQICLFASLTSHCYGCVLHAMRSCGHPAFFSLRWLWGICSLPDISFQVWFCHWSWVNLGRKGMGRAQQNPSEGLLSRKHSKKSAPTSLGPPAIPFFLPTPLDTATILDYSVISLLVSTSFWNLLYF